MEAEVRSRLTSLGLEAQQLILAIQKATLLRANSLIDEAEHQSGLFFEYLRTKVS